MKLIKRYFHLALFNYNEFIAEYLWERIRELSYSGLKVDRVLFIQLGQHETKMEYHLAKYQETL